MRQNGRAFGRRRLRFGPAGGQAFFYKMLRFDSSRLSVHPVEPPTAGTFLPTVRPPWRRLSVVLTLAADKSQKPALAPQQERFRSTIEYADAVAPNACPLATNLIRFGGRHGRE